MDLSTEQIIPVGLAGGAEGGVDHGDLLDAARLELGQGIGGEIGFKLEDTQLIIADILPDVGIPEIDLVHPGIMKAGQLTAVVDDLHGFEHQHVILHEEDIVGFVHGQVKTTFAVLVKDAVVIGEGDAGDHHAG